MSRLADSRCLYVISLSLERLTSIVLSIFITLTFQNVDVNRYSK